MTYPPKDILTMWDRVNEVLTTNQEAWSKDDAICNAAFRFRLFRNEIIDVIEAATVVDATGKANPAPVATASTEGSPLDNNAAKEAAVAAALPIAGAIRQWAEKTDNDAIASNMNLNDGDLRDMRDTLTADRLRLIHTTGISNMGELARYGVGQPALADLMDKIRAYEMVNPRSIANRWTGENTGSDLSEIISEGMALLNDTLDPAVEGYSAVSPKFVEMYKGARAGMDLGPSHVPPTLGKL